MNISVSFEIFGQELIAECEVEITSKSYAGRRPDMNHPGEQGHGPEWQVNGMSIKKVRENNKYLSCPDWLFNLIAGSDELDEKVCESEQDYFARDPDDAYEARRG